MSTEPQPETQSETMPGAQPGTIVSPLPTQTPAPSAVAAGTKNTILNNFPVALEDRLKSDLVGYNIGKTVQLSLSQYVTLLLSNEVQSQQENERLRTALAQLEERFKTAGEAPADLEVLRIDNRLLKELNADLIKKIEDLEFKLANTGDASGKVDNLLNGVKKAVETLLDHFEDCAGAITYDRTDLEGEFWTIARDHFTASKPA